MCTRELSFFGCHLKNSTCKYPHEVDLAKIMLAKVQVYPSLEAFLVGRYDGPKQLSNSKVAHRKQEQEEDAAQDQGVHQAKVRSIHGA